MSILSSNQIKEIIIKRPGATLVQEAEKMHKKLSTHINGLGLAEYLDKIETYEKPEALALRKRYARSNIDLFDRLARPIDKVFVTRGSSIYFPSTADDIARKMDVEILNVEKGYSAKKWVETFWKTHYLDDPMGLIFMEVLAGETYPTYKASTDIWDYKLNGRKLDWVVFKTEDKSIFRVVDDSFDALYKLEGAGDSSSVRKTKDVYPNYFGYVPGIIISDIPKAGMQELYVSPFNSLVELADEYLRDESIRMIYKFKHGFPKSWKYREMCGDCKGTGARGAQTCSVCNGTGKKLDSSVSEVMVLDWPTANDQVIAPDVAGFITPDIEYLKYSRDELKHLESLMYKTHWGTFQTEQRMKGESDTATSKFQDMQPLNDKLNAYADAAETTEKFIIDSIGAFLFPTGFGGCRVAYGRRFMVEGPDVIWRKYEQARKMGAPMGTLNDHLVEYYEAKFQSNPLELARYLKMMRVEPFIHLTVSEAFAVVGPEEFAKKLYFAEWASTIKEVQWLTTPDDILKAMLSTFAADRYEPPTPTGAGATSAQADPNNLVDAGGADNASKGTKSKNKNPDGTPAGASTKVLDN